MSESLAGGNDQVYVAPRHLERSRQPSHTVVVHATTACPYLDACESRHRGWPRQIRAGSTPCLVCNGGSADGE